jgi:uncharacterized membrane protein YkoI
VFGHKFNEKNDSSDRVVEVGHMTFNSLMKFILVVLILGTAAAVLPATASAQDNKDAPKKVEREDDDDDDDEELSAEDKQRVKLSLEEARTIATGRVSGKVIDEELEKERGRLQYAFDIRDEHGKVWDVEIDAITGEVLQALEDDDDDEQDARTTKNKKKDKKKQAERTAKVVKVKPN